MVFIVSSNCKCGQPILSVPLEAPSIQDIDLLTTAGQLRKEMYEAVGNGTMSRHCPTCHKPLDIFETELLTTSFKTLQEAEEEMLKYSEGRHESMEPLGVTVTQVIN